jgi:hypothetical protein
MARIDIEKYHLQPIEQFIKVKKPKKKEEPIVTCVEDLIKYYNNGAPIYPDLP